MRTFVFADLGDDVETSQIARFHRLATECLQGDSHVTTVGCTLLISAKQTHDAIMIARLLARASAGSPTLPPLRIGIDVGSVTVRDEDYFAATRNIASRVSTLARDGEVVCTEAVAQIAVAHALASARPIGTYLMGRPVAVYVLVNRVDDCDELTHIDPVCGRAVLGEAEQARSLYEGVELHFCSDDCAMTFEQNPESYLAIGSAKPERCRAPTLLRPLAQPTPVATSPGGEACRRARRASSGRTRGSRSRARRTRSSLSMLLFPIVLNLAELVDGRWLAMV